MFVQTKVYESFASEAKHLAAFVQHFASYVQQKSFFKTIDQKKMSIKIVLIEKFSSPEKDECLFISKQNSKYLVEYVPSSKHSKQRQTFVFHKMQEVYAYLNAFANFVSLDKDPLHGIQVFVPGFPSIVLDAIDFGSVYIQNCLSEAFGLWHRTS